MRHQSVRIHPVHTHTFASHGVRLAQDLPARDEQKGNLCAVVLIREISSVDTRVIAFD